MAITSVVRMVSKENNEEPKETIIIKRCNMSDFEEITDEELEQIIKDLDSTPEEEMEYLGDEEADDEEVEEFSDDEMMDDTDDYL